jgi:hypothetical protein
MDDSVLPDALDVFVSLHASFCMIGFVGLVAASRLRRARADVHAYRAVMFTL